MKPNSGQMRFFIAFAILLCGGAFPLWSGVEDLLEPIDFSAYKKQPAVIALSAKRVPVIPARYTVPTKPALASISKERLQTSLGAALVRRFGISGEMQVEIGQLNLSKFLPRSPRHPRLSVSLLEHHLAS